MSSARETPAPLRRHDTLRQKQKLHDVLGDAGLVYWRSFNAYLLGKLSQREFVDLVRSLLKTPEKIDLHNQLVKSILYNASLPDEPHPAASQMLHKRRRMDGTADFDSDATYIEPVDRVREWIMGMGGKERERVRRAADEDGAAPEEVSDWDVGNGERKRKYNVYASTPAHPPLAQTNRTLPSASQLASRLAQVAKPLGLDLDPDQARDVGEFMGVGLQTHLGEMLHSYVHLTGRDRPGEDTMRVPLGTKNANVEEEEHDVPKPDLSTIQSLFTLAPGLQATVSPALYKLGSGLTIAEYENNNPPPRKPTPASAAIPPPPFVAAAAGNSVSPKKAAQAIQTAAVQGRVDTVSDMLAETGLLKIDKGGHEHGPTDGAPKKEKKHTLHWKYEDPATLLKDVLG
ncbi:hypothetical protein CC85DRAFT_329890 [Cutaneotrichosporon oleaginosum]|uniref:Transcriptional regulator of RNA polII, SAGA, subunit-domain-containing protein n=1 Tax=Cutaneotrichosporon oleaginosum TaxID=879819 RepID=A0A0J0XHC2_9TREE|nr:uncharacterized protein CC85DRAFT_329890 [Cutaneotrichosporon oleaginosum]KLT40486.1 hypothetical protein CC85DRAFT_329890 [Cutaneotrichosporon oleaginosum]TXT15324.1 hypothetical protein COLE_01517 [Cutaneotrichosporon oleaginosum]